MKKLLIGVAILASSCNYVNTESIECAEVLEKERITVLEGGSYYLVMTDKGEYTVTDELFRGNFNSSQWYGKMKIGKSYSFKTGGYRIGLLSSYKNIHSKPLECN